MLILLTSLQCCRTFIYSLFTTIGYPFVLQVTKDVSLLSRWMAIDLYVREVDSLRFELSMSQCSAKLSKLARQIMEGGLSIHVSFFLLGIGGQGVVILRLLRGLLFSLFFCYVINGYCLLGTKVFAVRQF